MKTFSQLKKNLKSDPAHLKTVKVALLGDTATQFLVQALRGTAIDCGFNLEVLEADFNQIERQVFDPASELYAFNPEVVILFQSSHSLLSRYNKLAIADQVFLATRQVEAIESLYQALSSRLNAAVIYFNYSEIDDAVFGNYSSKVESSFLFQLRKLNHDLMLLSVKCPGLFICDLSSVQNRLGKTVLFHPSVYVNTEMVLSLDALPEIAARTLALISAIHGRLKKCVIVDLDNTLWGGVIGDDGMENIQLGVLGIGKAFTEFQYWLKKLKNRGVILAVCSKNTESVAREPFEQHPDMVLHMEDVSVFVANWENKVDNIRHIQEVLNIGFDSMVFLDDNPFERNMVRDNIPGITVPELPEDPAEYLEFLYSLNLFETVSHSVEDAERTRLYQLESQRREIQNSFANEEEFLESLNMLSLVEPFNKFNTPRVAQLSQRSNQFNLRTIRYGEAEVEKLSSAADYFTFAFTLEDKFGDHGMICVVVLKKENDETLFIENWLMSCRVLKRGMENFTLNTLAGFSSERGFRYLKGEYLPTTKNEMVRNHYPSLGFEQDSGRWKLAVSGYQARKCTIQKK